MEWSRRDLNSSAVLIEPTQVFRLEYAKTLVATLIFQSRVIARLLGTRLSSTLGKREGVMLREANRRVENDEANSGMVHRDSLRGVAAWLGSDAFAGS